MTVIAYTLAAVLDLFVLFIGARFLLQPRAAAAGYGVPAARGGEGAYLTVKGLRDGTFGIVGLALLIVAGAVPKPGSCSAWRWHRSATL